MATPERTCLESGCANKHYARGYCSNHYKNKRRTTGFADSPECSVEGCISPAVSKTLCAKHYQRWKKWGDPEARDPKFTRRTCSVDGCDSAAWCRGWCHSHYDKWNAHGDPLFRSPGEVRDGKRVCAGCGIDTPLEGMRRSRCKECARERSRAYYKYKRKADEVNCVACGSTFYGSRDKNKYCSDDCRAVGLAAIKTVRDRKIKQTTLEYFTREEVFNRDGWVCHICSESISPSLKYPHPMSASLDHVTPISRGGPHTLENSAASHFLCNIRKSDRMPA